MPGEDSWLSIPQEARPRNHYRSKESLRMKVLDFVKSGGPTRTRTLTWRFSHQMRKWTRIG